LIDAAEKRIASVEPAVNALRRFVSTGPAITPGSS